MVKAIRVEFRGLAFRLGLGIQSWDSRWGSGLAPCVILGLSGFPFSMQDGNQVSYASVE